MEVAELLSAEERKKRGPRCGSSERNFPQCGLTWIPAKTADMKEDPWRLFCKNLPCERWEHERQEVEERFSLFEPFLEFPFLGFRGVVGRHGVEYHVMVAAEVDFYPKYAPWVFVEPHFTGADERGKLLLDPSSGSVSTFADVIAATIAQIDRCAGESRSQ